MDVGHLLKAVPGRSESADHSQVPLWSDRSLVTDSWTDILSRSDTRILRDRRPVSAESRQQLRFTRISCSSEAPIRC